jgi:hypothetical protein
MVTVAGQTWRREHEGLKGIELGERERHYFTSLTVGSDAEPVVFEPRVYTVAGSFLQSSARADFCTICCIVPDSGFPIPFVHLLAWFDSAAPASG